MADESTHSFAAASNSQVATTTLLVSVVLIGVAAVFFLLAWQRRDQPVVKYALGGVAVLQLALVGLSTNFKIRGYDVSPGRLVVRHGWSRLTFPMNNFTAARIEGNPFHGAIRRGGVGGVWSFYGRFSSPQLGEFHAYVSDPQRAVVIQFTDQVVLVSPEEPDAFLAALLKSK